MQIRQEYLRIKREISSERTKPKTSRLDQINRLKNTMFNDRPQKILANYQSQPKAYEQNQQMASQFQHKQQSSLQNKLFEYNNYLKQESNCNPSIDNQLITKSHCVVNQLQPRDRIQEIKNRISSPQNRIEQINSLHVSPSRVSHFNSPRSINTNIYNFQISPSQTQRNFNREQKENSKFNQFINTKIESPSANQQTFGKIQLNSKLSQDKHLKKNENQLSELQTMINQRSQQYLKQVDLLQLETKSPNRIKDMLNSPSLKFTKNQILIDTEQTSPTSNFKDIELFDVSNSKNQVIQQNYETMGKQKSFKCSYSTTSQSSNSKFQSTFNIKKNSSQLQIMNKPDLNLNCINQNYYSSQPRRDVYNNQDVLLNIPKSKKPSDWTEYSQIVKDRDVSQYECFPDLPRPITSSECLDQELNQCLNQYLVINEDQNFTVNRSLYEINQELRRINNEDLNRRESQQMLYSFNEKSQEAQVNQYKNEEGVFQTFNSSNYATQPVISEKKIHIIEQNKDKFKFVGNQNQIQQLYSDKQLKSKNFRLSSDSNGYLDTPSEHALPQPLSLNNASQVNDLKNRLKNLQIPISYNTHSKISKWRAAEKIQRAFRCYLQRRTFLQFRKLQEFQQIKDNILQVLNKYQSIENSFPQSPKQRQQQQLSYKNNKNMFMSPSQSNDLIQNSYQSASTTKYQQAKTILNQYKRQNSPLSTKNSQYSENKQILSDKIKQDQTPRQIQHSSNNPFNAVYQILGEVTNHINNIDNQIQKNKDKTNIKSNPISLEKHTKNESQSLSQQYQNDSRRINKKNQLLKYINNNNSSSSNHKDSSLKTSLDLNEFIQQSDVANQQRNLLTKTKTEKISQRDRQTFEFTNLQNQQQADHQQIQQNKDIQLKDLQQESYRLLQIQYQQYLEQNSSTSIEQELSELLSENSCKESINDQQYRRESQNAFDRYNWMRSSKAGSIIPNDTRMGSLVQSQATPSFKDNKITKNFNGEKYESCRQSNNKYYIYQ